jgi:HJR/Mrr/RecB family endonuclease
MAMPHSHDKCAALVKRREQMKYEVEVFFMYRQFIEVEAASHNEAVSTATDLFNPDEADIVDTRAYAMEAQTGESK